MEHRDYYIGVVIGFFCSLLLLLVLFIIQFPYTALAPLFFVIPIIVIPLGLWVSNALQQVLGVGARFGKYTAAGLLSFSIDFSVLNILSFFTGITAGTAVGWINVPGFCFGLTNAYLWNKLWVFKKFDGSHATHFPRFFFVVLIGLSLNSLLVVWISTNITPPSAMNNQQWLNIAKLIASAAVVVWNFLGYKFIAFR